MLFPHIDLTITPRTYRRQQRLDHGQFDFVMREGTPIVLGVNRTQALPTDAQALVAEIVDALAAGLQSFGVAGDNGPAQETSDSRSGG